MKAYNTPSDPISLKNEEADNFSIFLLGSDQAIQSTDLLESLQDNSNNALYFNSYLDTSKGFESPSLHITEYMQNLPCRIENEEISTFENFFKNSYEYQIKKELLHLKDLLINKIKSKNLSLNFTFNSGLGKLDFSICLNNSSEYAKFTQGKKIIEYLGEQNIFPKLEKEKASSFLINPISVISEYSTKHFPSSSVPILNLEGIQNNKIEEILRNTQHLDNQNEISVKKPKYKKTLIEVLLLLKE